MGATFSRTMVISVAILLTALSVLVDADSLLADELEVKSVGEQEKVVASKDSMLKKYLELRVVNDRLISRSHDISLNKTTLSTAEITEIEATIRESIRRYEELKEDRSSDVLRAMHSWIQSNGRQLLAANRAASLSAADLKQIRSRVSAWLDFRAEVDKAWESQYRDLKAIDEQTREKLKARIVEAEKDIQPLEGRLGLISEERGLLRSAEIVRSGAERVLELGAWLENASSEQLERIREGRNQAQKNMARRLDMERTQSPLTADEREESVAAVKKAHDRLGELLLRDESGKFKPKESRYDIGELLLYDVEFAKFKSGKQLLASDLKLYKSKHATLTRYDSLTLPDKNCLKELTSQDKSEIQWIEAAFDAVKDGLKPTDPCCAKIKEGVRTRTVRFTPRAIRGFLAFHQAREYSGAASRISAELVSTSPVGPLPEFMKKDPPRFQALFSSRTSDPLSGTEKSYWAASGIRACFQFFPSLLKERDAQALDQRDVGQACPVATA